MNKKSLLLITSFIFLVWYKAQASPVYPYPVKVKTPRGETYITLQGDEKNKYAFSEDGYTIVAKGEKWFYVNIGQDQKPEISDYELEEKALRSNELKAFLAVVPKHIVPKSNTPKEVSVTRRAHQETPKVTGHRKLLVVLMAFTDTPFKKSQADFDDLFNQRQYNVDGAAGSVYDYYKYVSYGQLELECDVIGPFTASHNMAYYGGNRGMGGEDQNPYALFSEALTYASKQVDLKEYDGNNDGYIDNFHIIYAGYGEEAGAVSDAIWAHESTFKPLSIDGMMIDRYSCAPELRSNRGNGISRIGPHCHEIGHALGAMDYYDTNYDEGGKYPGTGQWDVMASGSWNNDGITPANFNSYVKSYNFGWTEVVTLEKDSAIHINPSTTNNVVYRILTPVNNDIFLLENRRKESFDSDNPGEGLLILHVGPNLENKSGTNSINASFPQNCYYVCASASDARPTSTPSSYGNVNSAGCPFPGSSDKHSFTPTTTPAALCVNGLNANFGILNIQETEGKYITLDYVAGSDSIETTDDTEIPLTGEIVWEEDFKGMGLPNGWTQECVIGNTQWTKKMSTKGGVIHFAELAYESSPWDSNTYISTVLKTHLFDVEQIDYVLSYGINRVSKSSTPDTLVVSLDNNELLTKNVLLSEGWETKSCVIKSDQVPFRIFFNGIVNKSSAIRLTNLKLRKYPITNGISKPSITNANNTNTTHIYSLSGNKLQTMRKGINIVRNPDGTFRKILME